MGSVATLPTRTLADSGNGVRSFLDARMELYNADDHKKYSHFWTQWYRNGWQQGDHLQAETGHSTQTSWSWVYGNTGVSPYSNRARARVRVCLDIPYRSDPCSGSTYTNSSYY